jgi:hypothetical protein
VSEKTLNRQIAEALGWTEIYDGVLTSASGMEGTTPEGREFQRIPDWQNDLREAWRLFMELPDEYTPRIVRILIPDPYIDGELSFWTKASILHNEGGDEVAVIHPDPTTAICEAWLKLRKPS